MTEPIWQRIAIMPDDTRLLITVYDNDPDSIEVCVCYPFDHRWAAPLPIEAPS